MDSIELIAKNYTNIISAISALGTWAAVIVALWLSYRTTKPKLRVFVDKSVHIPSKAQTGDFVDNSLCEDAISVTMQNRGNVTIYITYWAFIWRLPKPWTISAMQNPYLPNFKSEGIKLEPGQSASIFLTNDLKKHEETLKDLCRKNKVPQIMKRFISLKVIASDGSSFRGKFGKSYKQEFFKKSS